MPPAHKIAFIGSHSVRKTNAVHSFAGAVGRSGRSVEVGREMVRYNPLGLINRFQTGWAYCSTKSAISFRSLSSRSRSTGGSPNPARNAS